ncbi:hypothetical protein [Myceligenerans crystallogenes]
MTETERRQLANELARAGFDPDYLAHRYGLTRRHDNDWPDTTPGHARPDTRPGHDRDGQFALSAPATTTTGHANGRSSGQNRSRSNLQEGAR